MYSSVILIVSGVIYSNFDFPTEVIQKSPVVMKSSKGRSIREVKNLDSPKVFHITTVNGYQSVSSTTLIRLEPNTFED
jgi:hypothetical protein